MKRFLTMILVVPFAVGGLASLASADGTLEYGWTISNSHTSAYSNQGPFIPGLKSLYLWYACNSDTGMAAAEFDILSKNPANVILAFTPKSGFLNAGTATKLLLAVGGCPDAQPRGEPVNAGIILALSNAPGGYAIAPSNVNGNKVTVDCTLDPAVWPVQWIGYADEGEPPQEKDWDKCVKPVSVEEASWGRIKGTYR
jgi:hypothetical protein